MIGFDLEVSKIDKSNPDACWVWTANTIKDGYGHVRENGKMKLAHQIAWERVYGEIPENIKVCHSCDNPPCVNPKHLFLGTQKQNMEDMSRKGRHHDVAGYKHSRRKLSGDDIIAIRSIARGNNVFKKEIGQIFGISITHVTRIVNRESWLRNISHGDV